MHALFGYLSLLDTYIWVVFGEVNYKNGTQHDVCVQGIRLHAQNLSPILYSTINKIGGPKYPT